jgi:hypothetical protein
MKPQILAFFLVFILPFRVAAQQAPTHDAERQDSYWVRLHQSDDLAWAERTRVPAPDMRRLRLAAGIADERPLTRIIYTQG